jgi:hypothetical protein
MTRSPSIWSYASNLVTCAGKWHSAKMCLRIMYDACGMLFALCCTRRTLLLVSNHAVWGEMGTVVTALIAVIGD